MGQVLVFSICNWTTCLSKTHASNDLTNWMKPIILLLHDLGLTETGYMSLHLSNKTQREREREAEAPSTEAVSQQWISTRYW